MMDKFRLRGLFRVAHWRQDKLLRVYKFPNGIVDVGLDNILDVMFGGSAQTDPWHIGLIDNAGFTALANADTMASHAGWSELTAYTEATRIVWPDDVAASGSKTNSTTADFSMNATNSVNGVFITSDSTKGGAGGILWSTAQFSAPVPVVNLDVLKVTYTLNTSAS
jgi:hypothetical protein